MNENLKFQLTEADKQGNIYCVIRKNDNADDNTYISTDPANKDYAEYLEWVEAGNTPEAAD